MVTPTQGEATFWELQSWTYTCNACEQGWQTDSAGSSRMKAIQEYYKERSGCPQEGRLIWGETIIGD